MRIPDRGSTTGEARWTDHERSERAARRASEASQSPPHRHYLKKSSHENAGFFFRMYLRARGDENPRPGFDNGRQPVGQMTNAVSGLPAGRAKRVNPPRCAHRQRSQCLMAATPYQAYASRPTSCHVQLPDGGFALSGLHTTPYQAYASRPTSLPHKK
ncbi:UNVERIFIED_ORG: hypothetical protein QE398_002039 [Atlantibacter sp. SORGH_AS 304]|nr:hypothetical protein [Atlantibacter sp. SORGH_AS_0304]